ncbi:MAG: hypothetical protein ABIP90_07275 [Vicinamibacterales bacterium]
MLTRRELVTGTALGAVATVASTTDSDATPSNAAGITAATAPAVQEVDNAAIRQIATKTMEIDQTLDGLAGLARSNTLSFGYVPKLREAYTLYWKAHGKFPEFCEVGTAVFYDIYDWHIKNRLPIPVSRFADGRMSITFMYTQLLVRVDQAQEYIGLPFDRQ